MIVYLIRHSITESNLTKRYIGKTDEPLCPEGISLLEGRTYPAATRICVSPMKRCVQTAQIIYPGQPFLEVPELVECDFGRFEKKNYEELSDSLEYRTWVDSGGTLPFPGGESPEGFRKRSVRGFEDALTQCQREGADSVAFVVHGGTIMSIMEKYASPAGTFFDYQIGNGEGYELMVMDVPSGDGGVSPGSSAGRSGMALSSGPADGTSDHDNGKNYKKLSFGQ